jgi:gas vesicle protein
MTSTTKIVLGLLAAAAAGAAIGVLIAPEKGSDLRKRIKTKASEWADELSDLLATGKREMNEAFSKAEDAAENLKSNV